MEATTSPIYEATTRCLASFNTLIGIVDPEKDKDDKPARLQPLAVSYQGSSGKSDSKSIQPPYAADQSIQIGVISKPEKAKSTIKDNHARFRIWAGNLGAYQRLPSRSSADFRLREAPEVAKRLLEILEDVAESNQDIVDCLKSTTNTDAAKDEDGDADVLEDLCLTVGDSLTSLLKVSALLRKATTRDRYALAVASKHDILPEEYSKYDLKHVLEKFPKTATQKWLQQRLASAITQRRRYLRYAQGHQKRIANEKSAKPTPEKIASPTPAPVRKEHDHVSIGNTLTRTLASTKASTLLKAKVAETNLENLDAEDDDDNLSHATSFISTASGKADPGRAQVVKLEDLTKDHEPFECPYCRAIVQFKNQRSWRKHVFRDLRAYVCTHEDCDVGIFEDKQAWFNHELEQHRRVWICLACPNKSFDTEASFRSHLQLFHKYTDPTIIANIASSASRPVVEIGVTTCPLCDEWAEQPKFEPKDAGSTSVSTSLFRQHLGSHHEQLALFAITPDFERELDSEHGSQDSNVPEADREKVLKRWRSRISGGDDSEMEREFEIEDSHFSDDEEAADGSGVHLQDEETITPATQKSNPLTVENLRDHRVAITSMPNENEPSPSEGSSAGSGEVHGSLRATFSLPNFESGPALHTVFRAANELSYVRNTSILGVTILDSNSSWAWTLDVRLDLSVFPRNHVVETIYSEIDSSPIAEGQLVSNVSRKTSTDRAIVSEWNFLKMLTLKVREDIERIFSVENLRQSREVRAHMDSQGFVLMDVVKKFGHIAQLTDDKSIMVEACNTSDVAEAIIGEDEVWRIRKRAGWEEFVLPIEERVEIAKADGPRELYDSVAFAEKFSGMNYVVSLGLPRSPAYDLLRLKRMTSEGTLSTAERLPPGASDTLNESQDPAFDPNGWDFWDPAAPPRRFQQAFSEDTYFVLQPGAKAVAYFADSKSLPYVPAADGIRQFLCAQDRSTFQTYTSGTAEWFDRHGRQSNFEAGQLPWLPLTQDVPLHHEKYEGSPSRTSGIAGVDDELRDGRDESSQVMSRLRRLNLTPAHEALLIEFLRANDHSLLLEKALRSCFDSPTVRPILQKQMRIRDRLRADSLEACVGAGIDTVSTVREHMDRPLFPILPVSCVWPGCKRDFDDGPDMIEHVRVDHGSGDVIQSSVDDDQESSSQAGAGPSTKHPKTEHEDRASSRRFEFLKRAIPEFGRKWRRADALSDEKGVEYHNSLYDEARRHGRQIEHILLEEQAACDGDQRAPRYLLGAVLDYGKSHADEIAFEEVDGMDWTRFVGYIENFWDIGLISTDPNRLPDEVVSDEMDAEESNEERDVETREPPKQAANAGLGDDSPTTLTDKNFVVTDAGGGTVDIVSVTRKTGAVGLDSLEMERLKDLIRQKRSALDLASYLSGVSQRFFLEADDYQSRIESILAKTGTDDNGQRAAMEALDHALEQLDMEHQLNDSGRSWKDWGSLIKREWQPKRREQATGKSQPGPKRTPSEIQRSIEADTRWVEAIRNEVVEDYNPAQETRRSYLRDELRNAMYSSLTSTTPSEQVSKARGREAERTIWRILQEEKEAMGGSHNSGTVFLRETMEEVPPPDGFDDEDEPVKNWKKVMVHLWDMQETNSTGRGMAEDAAYESDPDGAAKAQREEHTTSEAQSGLKGSSNDADTEHMVPGEASTVRIEAENARQRILEAEELGRLLDEPADKMRRSQLDDELRYAMNADLAPSATFLDSSHARRNAIRLLWEEREAKGGNHDAALVLLDDVLDDVIPPHPFLDEDEEVRMWKLRIVKEWIARDITQRCTSAADIIDHYENPIYSLYRQAAGLAAANLRHEADYEDEPNEDNSDEADQDDPENEQGVVTKDEAEEEERGREEGEGITHYFCGGFNCKEDFTDVDKLRLHLKESKHYRADISKHTTFTRRDISGHIDVETEIQDLGGVGLCDWPGCEELVYGYQEEMVEHLNDRHGQTMEDVKSREIPLRRPTPPARQDPPVVPVSTPTDDVPYSEGSRTRTPYASMSDERTDPLGSRMQSSREQNPVDNDEEEAQEPPRNVTHYVCYRPGCIEDLMDLNQLREHHKQTGHRSYDAYESRFRYERRADGKNPYRKDVVPIGKRSPCEWPDCMQLVSGGEHTMVQHLEDQHGGRSFEDAPSAGPSTQHEAEESGSSSEEQLGSYYDCADFRCSKKNIFDHRKLWQHYNDTHHDRYTAYERSKKKMRQGKGQVKEEIVTRTIGEARLCEWPECEMVVFGGVNEMGDHLWNFHQV